MKRIGQCVVVCAFAVVIAGCAQQQYQMVKNGVSQQEVTQDDAHCRMEAGNVQTADYEYRGSFMEGANILHKQKQAYALCMTSLGYNAVATH